MSFLAVMSQTWSSYLLERAVAMRPAEAGMKAEAEPARARRRAKHFIVWRLLKRQVENVRRGVA